MVHGAPLTLSLARGVGLLDMSARPANPDTDFFTEKMWDFAPWPGARGDGIPKSSKL